MESDYPCFEEYKKYIRDDGYANVMHYKTYVLPVLLINHPYILKLIENKKIEKLTESFCNILIDEYYQTISGIK